MEELKETKNYIVKWTALLNLIIILILLCFDFKSAFGWFVGGLMSIINFILLSHSLQKAVKFPPIKAQAYVFIQYIFRYLLWFTVFYIALKRPDVNLLTTIVGMLSVKIVILLSNLFKSYPQKEEVVRKEGN
ncbi:ATP synthase subunit I [Orenia marismortui]|uniref:ATP synthase subunit I n=1 Tax=Orenia marismortui TaxID=46469 RepID=UPI00036FE875|nr:ATP synthase subunit I [Orenia marismortui]